MPILGQVPTPHKQVPVILTNGTQYLQTTLIDVTPEHAVLHKPFPCHAGLYRVFPLFPEKDGLFELQGEIRDTATETVKLKL